MNVTNDKGIASGTIVVNTPPAGERVVVALAPGATVQFEFPLDDIAFRIIDGVVVLTRADGGEVVLEGLEEAQTWQEPPGFLLPDGTILPAEALLAVSVAEGELTETLDEVEAASLNEIETAAGEEQAPELREEQLSPIVVPKSGLEVSDALAETTLETGEERRFDPSELPETLPNEEQPVQVAESVAQPLGEPLLSVSQAFGAEDEAIPLAIGVTGVGGDGTQTLSITVSGLPVGASLSAGQDNGDSSWTLTPAELNGLTVNAPSHSAEDFELTVTAVATQSDGTSTASSAPAEVVVNVVADTPELVVGDATAQAADTTLIGTSGADTLQAGHGSDTIIAGRGHDVIYADSGAATVTAELNIEASLTDTDGSESLSILVYDVPSGGRLSAGQQVSENTWVLTPAELASLTITVPADTSPFALTITAASSDVDPDSGLTDSTASMATINIAVEPPLSADIIDAGIGNDTVYAGAGADSIQAGGGADVVYSGSGDDTAAGGTGADILYGGTGDDALLGGGQGDTLFGEEGADRLEGEAGSDVLIGGVGDDVLFGGSSGDMLYGNEGADTLEGGAGADTLYGGADNDVLLGGDAGDKLYGGEGADTLEGGAGTNRLYGDAGDDVLLGGKNTDQLYGGAGDDAIEGGAGKDRLYGEAGDDVLRGGTGVDRVYGGAGDDALEGGGGKDRLYGGAGDDIIVGGTDKDIMEGGGGSDRYVWDNDDLAGKPDVINDFETGLDKIDISSVLDGYDPESSDINDYVQVSTKRGDTTLSVGTDGSGDWDSFAVLEGVMDFDIERDILATPIDPDNP